MKDQAKTKEQLVDELAELRRRVAELEAVETERKRAEKALRGALAELTVIQQNVPIAMMLVDSDRRVHKVNETASLFAGRPEEEMLGLRSGEALRCLNHLDDPQGCGFGPACATCAVRLAVLDTSTTHESKRDVEAWLPFAQGDAVEERCLLVSTAYLQMDDAGRVLICTQDITERKRAEKTLREAELRYRTVADFTYDWEDWKNPDGTFRYVSPACERITGYAAKRFMDEPGLLFQLILPEDREIWAGHRRDVAETPELHEVQFRIRRSDGEIRWVEHVCQPVTDQQGAFLGYRGSNRDITERKRVKQERLAHLRFTENMDQISRAIQGTNDLEQMMSDVLDVVLSIFECDRAWFVYPCDPEAPTWQVPMERTRPEYPGALALKLEIPVDSQVVRVYKAVLASEDPVGFGPGNEQPLPADVAKKFNEQSQLAMAIYPKMDKPYMFGIHQCSRPRVWTPEERKLLKEIGTRLADALTSLLTYRNLKESEQRYRMVFENSPVSIWEEDFSGVKRLFDDLKMEGVTDIETYLAEHPETVRQCVDLTRIVDVNRAALALHAAANKEDLLAGLVNVFTPESFDAFRHELVSLWNGETEMTRDAAVKTLAGEPRNVTVYISVCPGYEKALSKVLVSLTDITEHKQMEQALAIREQAYRTLLESVPDFIVRYDRGLRRTYVNPAWEKASGLSREEVINVPAADVPKVPYPIVDEYVEKLRQALATGTPQATEFTWVNAYGVTLFLDYVIVPEYDHSGKMVGVLAVGRDITERKQAEEALREKQNQLLEAQHIAHIGNWWHDLVTDEIYWSDEFFRIIGLEPQKPTVELVVATIHPDDWHILQRAMEEAAAGKVEHEHEFRIMRPDGGIRWIHNRWVGIYDKAGKEIKRIGTHQDITERKRAEEERARAQAALRESEELLRITLENILDPIFITDDVGGFTYICSNVPNALGYSVEEIRAMGNISLLIRGDLPLPQELHALGEIRDIEGIIEAKSGDTRDFLISAKRVSIGDGTILYSCHDIAERKRAEEALRQSEERFRALYEDNPSMYFMVDAQGTVLSVNPFGAEQLGYAVEELIGQSVLNVFYPDDRKAVQQQLIACLEYPGQVAHWELRKVRQDGSVLWVREAARAVQGPDGRPVVLVVCEDITERRRAEAEREHLLAQVREQAHRVQGVVDTVPEGVLLLDADCRVVLTNPLGQKDLAALAGAQVGDVLTRLGDRPLAELLASPPKGLWHKVATQSQNFQVLARPVENDTTPKGWVLVIRDVTQQYESERRIQQQERLAAVGQLAAGIAHDFNNIMAVIVLYAQMTARSAALSDRDRGRLTIINEQAHQATRLIQQILDFSRRAVLERQPLDLLPLLKEQVQLLERTLPEHIAIRLDYGHGEYTVNADPTRMQQMVMNLAVNARDAMPEGGVLRIALERITVELDASPLLPELAAGDWIRLSVADTGVGIPPKVLPHIFEPFYTTKPPNRGSGLGLAQVHGIVAQHEGRIDVETQVGAGTTFTFYLPALEMPPTVPLSPAVSIVAQGKGEVVLVVEDSAPLRATLQETLTEWGYQVREADDGEQALALLEELEGVADLVLSDVVMPEMGGVALVHAIRERGWKMPVILLSGYPQERDVPELNAHGVSAWLSKPLNMEALAEVVAQALRKD